MRIAANNITNNLPKSELCRYFRQASANALREWRAEKALGMSPHKDGLLWGQYMSYKSSAWYVAIEMHSTDVPSAPVCDYGKPEFLTQEPEHQFKHEQESEARVHSTPNRVNPHE